VNHEVERARGTRDRRRPGHWERYRPPACAGRGGCCGSGHQRSKRQKVSAEIKALGRKTEALTVDVSKEKEVYAMVDKVVADFGKLDIMVANAGIANIKLSVEMTAEEWDKIFASTWRGVFCATWQLQST